MNMSHFIVEFKQHCFHDTYVCWSCGTSGAGIVSDASSIVRCDNVFIPSVAEFLIASI